MKNKPIRSRKKKKRKVKKESIDQLLSRLIALKMLREITLNDLKQQLRGNVIKAASAIPKLPPSVLGATSGIVASELLNRMYGKIAKKPLPLIGKYPWLLHILGGAAGAAAAPHIPQAMANIAEKLNSFIGNIKRNQSTKMY